MYIYIYVNIWLCMKIIECIIKNYSKTIDSKILRQRQIFFQLSICFLYLSNKTSQWNDSRKEHDNMLASALKYIRELCTIDVEKAENMFRWDAKSCSSNIEWSTFVAQHQLQFSVPAWVSAPSSTKGWVRRELENHHECLGSVISPLRSSVAGFCRAASP